MMDRKHLDDQIISKLLMKSTSNKIAQLKYKTVQLGGGDNRAEKHRNRHRSILILQLLPQTAKAQSIPPQTTKYRYRRVTFKQRNH